MSKVVMPHASVLNSKNNVIESKDRIWQFSIANEGDSEITIGVKNQGVPFLIIPAKPDDSPAYPRVWSTNNPEIPFGADFVVGFLNETAFAHIITFSTVNGGKILENELKP